ncbi:flagellar assembly protein FliH [Lentibacillus sp. JNUCC-1]|uniref:flagellar assembly protein FliH n=1 Tax=Lentibacillus sp. JNUCC-1 TaxID=2654513 RepID=UPI0018D2147D|nr:flagellar assembly protein FliH [Lentibacillus sp. JNUCC-1]
MSNLSHHIKQIRIKPIHISKRPNHETPDEEISVQQAEEQVELLKNDITRLKEEQSALIEETNTSIHEEKRKWAEEKQGWIEEAQREGYEQGFSSGKEEALKSYSELLQQANSIVDLGKSDYYETVQKSTDAILDLGIRTAEKILHSHLEKNPESFLTIVHHAINELKNQSDVSIYLSPENYEQVLKQKDELVQLIGENSTLNLYIKEDMVRNQCLIEHPYGQIDAGIDTQLTQIRKSLLDYTREQNQ